MGSLHALTQSKYPFISAGGVGPSISVYSYIRAVGQLRREGLELFFLTVPEQGSPYEGKSSLSFVPANFAPGLPTSLALMLRFGALRSPVPPSGVSLKRSQLEQDPGL